MRPRRKQAQTVQGLLGQQRSLDFFFIAVLGIEPRVLSMLGKCSTSELHSPPEIWIFIPRVVRSHWRVWSRGEIWSELYFFFFLQHWILNSGPHTC
jgi:hypothetical protein